MSALKCLPALLAVALVIGCSKPEAKYVGTYTGKLQISQASKDKLAKLGAQAAMVEQQIEKATINLNLKDDMTYTVSASGVPASANSSDEGKWAFADNQITLTSTKDKSKPQPMTIESDGSLSFMLPGGGDTTVKFTKSSS